jgi:hypothetical protein
MAQHDYDLANAGGSAFRSDLNSALAAIVSNNSGSSAPSTTFAYMWGFDTSHGLIKQRNAANAGWIIRGTLAETRILVKNGAYTAVLTDYGCLIRATNTWSLALTAAATLGDGWQTEILNAGTGLITIDPNASEQVDGASTLIIYPGESVCIKCDGSAFRTTGRASGPVLLQTQSASASSQLDFTQGINSDFNRFSMTLTDIVPATNAVDLWLRVSEDGGSTFKSGGSDYGHQRRSQTDGASPTATGSTGDTKIVLTSGISSAANKTVNGTIEFWNPSGASRNKQFQARTLSNGATWANYNVDADGTYIGTVNAINGVRLLMSSGNIASGTVSLYGWRK